MATTANMTLEDLKSSSNNTLAVYDSGYVALALHYGYPLISIDQP